MDISYFGQALVPLLENTAFIVIAILLLCSMKRFRKMLAADSSMKEKAFAGLVFGLLAIYGTLSAKSVEGALLNVRDLAPVAGGFLGGPVVGIVAGLLGGAQRLSMGGFTAVPCALATLVAGTAAGLLAERIRGKYFILKAAAIAAFLELFHMGLILLIAQPFEKASILVEKIAAPMAVANALGIACALCLAGKK
ncbi:MAG: LytS/YhcK type 5TM receptor domain-containing protein [Patescibacteria group bacterium]